MIEEILQDINRAMSQGVRASPTASPTTVKVGTVARCYGDVRIARLDVKGGARKAEPGMVVNRGEIVTTAEQELCSVTFRLNDGTEMYLSSGASVIFDNS